MAFEQETNLTKDGIEDFEIILFVPGPGNVEGVQAGKVDFQISMSDGSIQTKNADLLERLADDAPGLVHLSALVALRDYIRNRLNNEALP